MDCLNCSHSDCINNSSATEQETAFVDGYMDHLIQRDKNYVSIYKYNKSDRGKETRSKYEKSSKGKATRQAYVEKNREALRNYQREYAKKRRAKAKENPRKAYYHEYYIKRKMEAL